MEKNFITSDFVKQVHQCDTLFTDIDTVGDCQISLLEFEAYVQKRNPDKEDHDEVMKEFRKIDINQDGYLDFLEFLRACCLKNGVPMPYELNVHDKV